MWKQLVGKTALLAVLATSTLAPTQAFANETGKKNTTLGLGAAAGGLLLTQGLRWPTLLTGAGAAYSYSQYEREHQRNKRERAYRQGYRNGQNDRYYAHHR